MSTVTLFLVLLGVAGNAPIRPTHPPAPAEIAAYTPENAAQFVWLDTAAAFPGLVAGLDALDKSPLYQAPPLRQLVSQGRSGVTFVRSMVKRTFAFDPLQDVHWMALWIVWPPDAAPGVAMVSGGRYPPDLVARVARTTGRTLREVAGLSMVSAGRPGQALGVTGEGRVVVGPEAWVEWNLRTRAGKRRPAAGTLAADAATLLKERPVFGLASRLDATLRPRVLPTLRRAVGRIATSLLTYPVSFSGYVAAGRVGWRLEAADAAGVEAVERASSGVVSMLRAAHHVARGAVDLLIAALPSRGRSGATLKLLYQHRSALRDAVQRSTGDGRFKVRATVDRQRKTVTVVARAKRLGEILPVGALLPAAAVVVLGLRGGSAPKPARPARKRERKPARMAPRAPPDDDRPGMDIKPRPPPLPNGKE